MGFKLYTGMSQGNSIAAWDYGLRFSKWDQKLLTNTNKVILRREETAEEEHRNTSPTSCFM